MKILKITPWYPCELSPLGGSFVQDQALALQKEGLDVGVLFAEMDMRQFFRKLKTYHFKSIYKDEDGIKVFGYYGFFPPKINYYLFKKWSRFYEVLFKEYTQQFGLPDILHAHTFHGAFVAEFLSRKYKIPYVVTEHASYLFKEKISGFRRKIISDSLKNATQVIAVSNGLKNVLKTYTQKEIIVVPNLIDTTLFSLNKAPKKKGKFQLIAAGNLIPVKGFHLLVEAISRIRPEIKSDILLKIFGRGTEEKRLKKLINKFKLQDHITLFGEVPRLQLAEEMKNADIYILSSSFETFGIVVIEAMATGLPVISTKCFGPEDIVTKESGILISFQSVAALTDAIEEMYQNHLKYNPLDIRKIVLDNYAEDVVAQKLTSIYESALR